MNRLNQILSAAVVAVLLSTLAYAGMSNVDGLTLSGVGLSSTTVLSIENGSGTEVLSVNTDGDLTAVDVTASGTVTLSGTVALGSVVPTMATSSYFWVTAAEITCADSNGCSEGEQGGKETRVFADSTTDDLSNITIGLPPDFAEGTSGLHVQILYNMPSGTPAEGEWNLDYLAVADDDADAALGGALTVLDTPAAADDWNLTSAMIVPVAAITSSDSVVTLSLYHDVDDPFGGVVEVAAVKIGYTTDKNY